MAHPPRFNAEPSITSQTWLHHYEAEAPPVLDTASIFADSEGPDAVRIPSHDAAQTLSAFASRQRTFDSRPAASLSSRPAASLSSSSTPTTTDWLFAMLSLHNRRLELNQPDPSIDTTGIPDWLESMIRNKEPSHDGMEKLRRPRPSEEILHITSMGSIEPSAPSKPLAPVVPEPPPPVEAEKTKSGDKARHYIEKPDALDVLCGRGGQSNHHSGNKRYRQVVSEMKAKYRDTAAKRAKTSLSKSIVEFVCNYGGRFLKKDPKVGRFYIMTKDEARKKTSQALRETKDLKWTLGDESN